MLCSRCLHVPQSRFFHQHTAVAVKRHHHACHLLPQSYSCAAPAAVGCFIMSLGTPIHTSCNGRITVTLVSVTFCLPPPLLLLLLLLLLVYTDCCSTTLNLNQLDRHCQTRQSTSQQRVAAYPRSRRPRPKPLPRLLLGMPRFSGSSRRYVCAGWQGGGGGYFEADWVVSPGQVRRRLSPSGMVSI